MKLNQYSEKYFGKTNSHSGPRLPSAIDLVVIHDTEGTTAEGGAYTLTHRPDASTHVCVDDNNTFRVLPDTIIAWCVKSYNTHTIHVEQAGLAGWSEKGWLEKVRTIRRAAYWTAYWMHRYNIPFRFRSVADLNAGRVRGYTSHNNLSLSNISDSTHTDPGPNYPWRTLNAGITYYLGRAKARTLPAPKAL
jgi:N-acetyl-anhydromuramyl-L-alanine amidase AmpD